MAIRNLEKHLQDWQTQGFVNAEQAQAIRNFEEARAPGSRLRLALTLIAVFSMGLGLISLIAANWDQIPAWLKLATWFALMLGQAAYLLRVDQTPGLRREALHFSYILSILAGIGLIAQVFHVPSDGWRGMALWSALSLGLTLRARSWYTVLLWYGGFTWAWLGFVLQHDATHFVRLEAFMVVVALLSILGSWQGRGALPTLHRSLTLILGTAFLMILGPWLFLAEKSVSLREVAVACVLSGLWLGVLSRRLTRAQLMAASLVALGFFARWWIMEKAHGGDFLKNLPNFFETLVFLMQMTALGILALTFHASRLFDVLTLLMAARLFMLFFTLLGTLFTTGAGLILFGVLVLGLLHLWYRYHHRLEAHLKELLR